MMHQSILPCFTAICLGSIPTATGRKRDYHCLGLTTLRTAYYAAIILRSDSNVSSAHMPTISSLASYRKQEVSNRTSSNGRHSR